MRYFFVSLFLHLLVISLVWVGFSVPVGKDQNSFTYLGELVAVEQQAGSDQSGKNFESNILGESSPAFSGLWPNMRKLEKPR